MPIRVDKLSQPSTAKQKIDTGIGGASPFTWQGLDLVRLPWLLYTEAPGICNWTVNPTAAGLEFNNTQALVPPQTFTSYCGLIANGQFQRDSEGYLALSMHWDNFHHADDIANDLNLFSCFTFASHSLAFIAAQAASQFQAEAIYGQRAAPGPGENTNEKISYNDATNVRVFVQTHATATVDEYELQMQWRPAGIGGGQDASINCFAFDTMLVKRWIGGVPQADETNAVNRTLAGSIQVRVNSWNPMFLFCGLVQNRVSQIYTGRLTFIRLDRGRFRSL